MRRSGTVGIFLLGFGLFACTPESRLAGTFSEIREIPARAAVLSEARPPTEVVTSFSFSGRVLDAASGLAIRDFFFVLLPPIPADTLVLNALGSNDGLFHLSRTSVENENYFVSVRGLLQAPDYESQVVTLDIGVDCSDLPCPGVHPTAFLLKPKSAEGKSGTNEGITRAGRERVLVLLNPSVAPAKQSLRTVLTSVRRDRISDIAPSLGSGASSAISILGMNSPELSRSLKASKPLLKYLMPLVKTELPSAGTFGRLLSAALGALERRRAALWAMPGTWVRPNLLTSDLSAKLITHWIGRDQRFAGKIETEALASPWKESCDSASLLVQALHGPRGEVVSKALNEVLKGRGWESLLLLPLSSNLREQYAVLAPFLSPLMRALAGESRTAVLQSLPALTDLEDPAAHLRAIPFLEDEKESAIYWQRVECLMPSAQRLNAAVIAMKQEFAARFLKSGMHRELEGMEIESDVPGAAAVLVTGPKVEIERLSRWEDVERVEVLPELKMPD